MNPKDKQEGRTRVIKGEKWESPFAGQQHSSYMGRVTRALWGGREGCENVICYKQPRQQSCSETGLELVFLVE